MTPMTGDKYILLAGSHSVNGTYYPWVSIVKQSNGDLIWSGTAVSDNSDEAG